MKSRVCEIMSQVILADETIHIKLLGDSITHGVGGTGFEQSGEKIIDGFARNPNGYCWANTFKKFMESQYNCTVTNNACTGTNIEFLINNLDTLVSNEDDIIICTIGTNNRHKYFNSGEKPKKDDYLRKFRDNIVCLYVKINSMGKKVIFVANIPASEGNEADGEDYWRIFHMNDVQDAYVSASVKCGFPLICLYKLFLQTCRDRNINYETLLCDGLHPNDAGYDLMYEIIINELGLAEIPY